MIGPLAETVHGARMHYRGSKAMMARARQIRAKAKELREHLLSQQATLDARLAAQGTADPIRHVTGRSSLEQAIESTNAMIQSLDRILHEHQAPPIVTTVKGFSRTLTRVSA